MARPTGQFEAMTRLTKAYLRKVNGSVSNRELMLALGVGKTQVGKYLKALADSGAVKIELLSYWENSKHKLERRITIMEN